jgi:hypothetical protein
MMGIRVRSIQARPTEIILLKVDLQVCLVVLEQACLF